MSPLPPALDRAARFVYAAAASVYLFTVGLLSQRHRKLIGQIARHFGYDRMGATPSLATVPIAALTDPTHPVLLRAPDGAPGNVTLAELVALALLVRTVRPQHVFEIGTFDGRTTLTLADNAPEARVSTLDLPRTELDRTAFAVAPEERALIDKDASGSRFLAFADARARIEQCYGDSATFDFSPYAGRCQFVFIDGSHAYEYVRSDTERAFAMVGARGVIAWHDYGEWPGVTRALNEYVATDRRFGGLRRIDGTTLAILSVGGALPGA